MAYHFDHTILKNETFNKIQKNAMKKIAAVLFTLLSLAPQVFAQQARHIRGKVVNQDNVPLEGAKSSHNETNRELAIIIQISGTHKALVTLGACLKSSL